jgi:hypothetical protein
MNNDTNYKKKGLVVCEDIKQKKKKGCCWNNICFINIL